ncbi:uncharacterized protein PV09_08134 [Verruconis gallopava]|uniref:EH domain-containing protein n=1 Tax=Verruconis gallopava TaxID=253628 RepID=A0A0D1YHC7_9PEZI|nr:uncharacterized protein PV09_08134 [Verruconis gallopava]KIW00242.1 hypothetical protein PV09_08134 [Verruconis gallopava]
MEAKANERDARSLNGLTSASSRSQTLYNVPDAALAGALTAFSSVPCTTQRHGRVTRLQNGALSSATSAHNNSNSRNKNGSRPDSDHLAPVPPPFHARSYTRPTISTHPEVDGKSERKNRLNSTPASSPVVPRLNPADQPSRLTMQRPESLRAATLATTTSRSTNPRRSPPLTASSNQPTLDARALALQRRLNERMVARELDNRMDDQDDQRTDSTSIEPTKSLVRMFEQRSGGSSDVPPSIKRQPSLAKGIPPPIVAPKPQRALSVQSVSPELQRPDIPTKPKPIIKADKSETKKLADSDQALGDQINEKPQTKPTVPPPRRTAGGSKPTSTTNTASAGSPPSLSRFGLLAPTSTVRGTSSSPSSRVLPSNPQRASPAPYKDTSLHMLTPHMTGDSLANAMVGANLAIRSASPKRSRTPPPIPPSRRKIHAHDVVFGHSRARSLSPQKRQPGRLLTTLRTGDVEEKEKNRKHHFRQPNKHHEGTRERWRDYVSDSERKRYEGVWAANKGLFISSPDQADEVLNLVARDIWSRSRLPPERLAKVWDLVAVNGSGNGSTVTGRRTLSREQFVVGMWLIDQMLKGRNLPHSVNPSVWTSVRLMGVKVRLEGKGKDGRKLERGTVW